MARSVWIRRARRGALVALCLALSVSALEAQEWGLRLTVTSGVLNDPGNLVGRLDDSVDVYDGHDLAELPPIGPPYLSIVFPHPEWGPDAGDYTTDYREARLGAGGVWDFEVRSDVVRAVTIEWEGVLGDEAEILSRSVFEDVAAATSVVPTLGGSYQTTLAAPTASFRWVVDALPLVLAQSSGTWVEGDLLSGMIALFADEDPDDVHSATVDWGEGGGTEAAAVDDVFGVVTATHQWASPGLFTVEVCVDDGRGGVGCDAFSAEVVAAGDLVFREGFESGDLCAWGDASPPPTGCDDPPPPP